MKKYNFLFKPLFFIFSLIFATWLVLYIEKLRPSDLGKYEYIFKSRPAPVPEKPPVKVPEKQQQLPTKYQKECLQKVCRDYKEGLVDSTQLDRELERIFKYPEGLMQK
jgi:hypothetical protein